MGIIQNLRLIGPRVLVLRDPPETETTSGLHIPGVAQVAKNKTLQGTVIKVGPGGRSKKGVRLPISCAPGDRILYGFLDGEDIEEDGKHYVILENYEVRAILLRTSP